MNIADTFSEAKAQNETLNARVAQTSARLNSIPGINSGAMGLTPESVRLSPEYRTANADYAKAFADLRAFNGVYVKRFARELREERAERHAKRCAAQPQTTGI